MKFKNYLEQIAGVEIYPLISLGIFFTFFMLITLWVIRYNRATIKHMENLPLDNE